MENKTRAWTNGPWFVCPDGRNDRWRPGLTIGAVRHGARICDVFALAHEDFGAANARLIAAAPDLYEELERLAHAYKSLLQTGYDRITELGGTCDPVQMMIDLDPALKAARAALAKAETPHRPPQTDEGLG